MSYADITFSNKNPIVRWLQRKRLDTAIKLCDKYYKSSLAICDFGAGNGELCKLLRKRYKNAKLICYEPTPELLSEARDNLNAVESVEFYNDITGLKRESLDVVFCLEVFEHLPPNETKIALQEIYSLLQPDGILVVGVPVEIGIPALYKGIFRMSRRYGEFDARIINIALSLFGYPPKNRPVSDIAPGIKYHFQHMGFDFRSFKENMENYFVVCKLSASPFGCFGAWLMPEIFFVSAKANKSLNIDGSFRGDAAQDTAN